MDGAEDGEKTRPSGEALVHMVRVALDIGAKLIEKTLDGVAPKVEFAARHEAAVLGVEEEDEAQEGGDEAAVNLLRVLFPRVGKEGAFGLFIGSLKAAGQLEQSFEHLMGQSGGDVGLIVAAFPQEDGQAKRLGNGIQSAVGKQEVERGRQDAAGGLREGTPRKSSGCAIKHNPPCYLPRRLAAEASVSHPS
jgi:hypothetical protein